MVHLRANFVESNGHSLAGVTVRVVHVVIIAIAIFACQGFGYWQLAKGEELNTFAIPAQPSQLAHNEEYTSSASCQACHPEQHRTWHRSFHRTMTQAASPNNFVGRFDGTRIDSHGLIYQVFMREGQFWAKMPDPDEVLNRQRTYEIKSQRGIPTRLDWEGIQQVERRVVMSTGSHHYQTYWVESDRYPGTLMTLPLVYLIKDQRWIPRKKLLCIRLVRIGW